MSVTLVVGLPASGKSTWAKNKELKNVKIYDDFVPYFDKIVGKLNKKLDQDQDIYLIDPRLCLPNIWKHVIGQLACKFNIVLFENEPELCAKNLKRRNNDDRIVTEETIFEYSKHYKLENYTTFSDVTFKKIYSS